MWPTKSLNLLEFLFIDEIFTSIILFTSLSLPFLLHHSLGLYLQTNLARLVILQKRVVRIIANSNFDAHTDPIFKTLAF